MTESENDQRNERLWNETRAIASKMLLICSEDSLGESRETFAKRWGQAVDWSRIDEHGSVVIPEVLTDAFLKVVDENDTEKG